MLPKKERLTKKEFDRFFSLGKKINMADFRLVYSPDQIFKGSVVVGKKVSKLAVQRNKIRRRLYHLLSSLKKDNDLKGVYIIIAFPSSLQASLDSLRAQFVDLAKKLSKNN